MGEPLQEIVPHAAKASSSTRSLKTTTWFESGQLEARGTTLGRKLRVRPMTGGVWYLDPEAKMLSWTPEG